MHDAHRAERGHGRGLSGVGETDVLDAEPVISVRVAPRRVRERFERAGQADVAEGVDRDLKTALGGGADVGREVRKHRPELHRLAAVMSVDRGCHSTVGEELDGTDPETLVAFSGDRALKPVGCRRVENQRRVWHGQHADGEPARLSQQRVAAFCRG